MGHDRNDVAEEQCPNVGCCKLIVEQGLTTPALIGRIKSQYCLNSDHLHCDRFHVYQALSLEEVPLLMLPNQTEWAQQVIQEAKSSKPEEQKTVNLP